MKTNPIIRSYQEEDAYDLCRLFAQLDYPTDKEQLSQRLIAVGNHEPIGMIGFAQMTMFEADEDYIRILALVVEKKFRRKGVARALMDAVKDFAKDAGITVLALNSARTEERTAAHRFYKNQGFEQNGYGFKLSVMK